MAITTQKIYSLDHIFNRSFDDPLQILAVELLSTDPISGQLKKLTTQSFSAYSCNDLDDTTTTDVIYVGMEDADGGWIIKKLDETSGLSIRYANISNNATRTTYTTAWANRVTLTYEDYSVAF